MLRTPSKFLSRAFLRNLTENRFLSPSGKEYCEAEVMDTLHEKEHRLALIEYNRELKARAEEAREQSYRDQVTAHQERIINQRQGLLPAGAATSGRVLASKAGRCGLRNLVNDCQRLMPGEIFKDNTIFSLKGKKSSDEVRPQQRRQQQSGGANKRRSQNKRQPVKKKKSNTYTLKEVRRERAAWIKWTKEFNAALKKAGVPLTRK